MAKLEVGPMELAAETVRALAHPGVLLVSRDGNRRPNVMTIGWGSLGLYWGQPIFVVPVRPSRYTYRCLEKTGDFTVNVLPRKLADLAAFCGRVSGRDHDKLAEARLTPAKALEVRSPIIEECVINYECKVVESLDLNPKTLARRFVRSAYPRGDFHRLYFGEIVAVQAEQNLRRRL